MPYIENNSNFSFFDNLRRKEHKAL